MKKVMLFLFLILGWLGVKGQSTDNKGGWFMFKNANYNIEVKSIVEIAKRVDLIKPWEANRLSSGEEFTSVAPQLWGSMTEETITLIDGVKPISWADSIAYHGVIVPWDDNISGTVINYGVRKNGESFPASSNYTGGEDVWVLLYKGYPIMKVRTLCLNPLRPNDIRPKSQSISIGVVSSPTVAATPTTPIDVNVKVDISGVEKSQPEPEVESEQPSSVTNNYYYSRGYDDYGQEILYNPYTNLFGFYNRVSLGYDLLSWGQVAMRGFYWNLNDCRMRQNHYRVGDYYNEITNITNIDNSINNSYNTNQSYININHRKPKPETEGPGGAGTTDTNGPGGAGTTGADNHVPGGSGTTGTRNGDPGGATTDGTKSARLSGSTNTTRSGNNSRQQASSTSGRSAYASYSTVARNISGGGRTKSTTVGSKSTASASSGTHRNGDGGSGRKSFSTTYQSNASKTRLSKSSNSTARSSENSTSMVRKSGSSSNGSYRSSASSVKKYSTGAGNSGSYRSVSSSGNNSSGSYKSSGSSSGGSRSSGSSRGGR